jgi:hypothetical protein
MPIPAGPTRATTVVGAALGAAASVAPTAGGGGAHDGATSGFGALAEASAAA